MPTTYNFTGQRLDSVTGLLYYNARYYDPFSGRFTTADTVENNANGMDPYAYVGDDPVIRIDPTGHCDFWCVASWVGMGVGVVAAGVGIALIATAAAPVILAAAVVAVGAGIAFGGIYAGVSESWDFNGLNGQHALLAEGIGGLFGGVAYLATLDPVVDGMGALSFLPSLGVASVGGLLQSGVLLSHFETQQSSTTQTVTQTVSNSTDSQALKLLRANSSTAYSENLGPNMDYRDSHVAEALVKRNPLTSNLNWNWQSYEHTLWNDWVNSTDTVSSDSLLQYEMNAAYMLADWERVGAREGWE